MLLDIEKVYRYRLRTVLRMVGEYSPCIHQPIPRPFFVFFSRIYKFECNTTADWLNLTANPYGLANLKLCYIQMLLDIEKVYKSRLRTVLRMVGKYGPCVHQPFLRTFFVVFSRICKLECNTTSDLPNRTVWFGQSEVVVHSNAF